MVKKLFNWLGGRPCKQYTLGEMLIPASMPLNRGGRIVERAVFLGCGAATIAAGGGPLLVAYSLLGVKFGAATAGMVADLLVDFAKPVRRNCGYKYPAKTSP